MAAFCLDSAGSQETLNQTLIGLYSFLQRPFAVMNTISIVTILYKSEASTESRHEADLLRQIWEIIIHYDIMSLYTYR